MLSSKGDDYMETIKIAMKEENYELCKDIVIVNLTETSEFKQLVSQ